MDTKSVVYASSQFDWSGLAGSVAGAAIGAIAAFLFALWLARLESERQRRERLLEARKDNLLTTNAAVDACAQNIEELLVIKAQCAIPLAGDVEKMDAALKSGNPATVAATASTLEEFFLELQGGSFPELPPSDRFAFALDDAPYITSFVHRAETSVDQVNKSIEQRNEMLRRWTEIGRGPVSHADMSYFFTMLSSLGRAISMHVDDALFFNHLLHDQCYFIGVQRFSRPTFRHVVLPKAKAALMPPLDHLKDFRSRLVTFGFPPISLADDAAN